MSFTIPLSSTSGKHNVTIIDPRLNKAYTMINVTKSSGDSGGGGSGGGGGGGGSGGSGGGGWVSQPTNTPPTAIFNCTSVKPVCFSPVAFDAKNSLDVDGSIIKYDWSYGDGSKNTTSNPKTAHIYNKAGDYKVALIVSDNGGSSDIFSATIQVGKADSTFQREYSSKRYRLGDYVILKGTLVPSYADKEVTLNITSPGGVTKLMTACTDSSGSYHIFVSLNTFGEWKVTTYWVGTDDAYGFNSTDLCARARGLVVGAGGGVRTHGGLTIRS